MTMSRSVGLRNDDHRPTYGVVLAQAEPLIIVRLLVHLLHVAVRIAVHFHTVGSGGDAMVWAEHLVRGLGEDRRASLAELCHAVVEEVGIYVGLRQAVGPHVSLRLLGAARAVPMMLGNLWGELVVEVVLVERVGHVAVRRPAMAEGEVVEVWDIQIIEVVEVD